APVGRGLGFQPVERARSRVLTGSRLAELELAFSPAQEAAMFGRSALAAPVQGSIFPRPLLVSPTLKVAGSVCLYPTCLLVLALLLRRIFLFWGGLVQSAAA